LFWWEVRGDIVSIAEKLMTATEFELLNDDRRTELVRGRVVEMTPPKPTHGKIIFNIARIVGGFIFDRDLGHWFGEAGVITEHDPDSVRAPDAAFVSYERLPRDADGNRYVEVAPELVFEVFSPTDRWVDVLDKVTEYLRAGSKVVCVVVPSTRSIQVHRADIAPVTLVDTDDFELLDILPGFCCQVSEFFPRQHKK
jgi:Uma2 family endonuclease